jgi:hypothetical protein
MAPLLELDKSNIVRETAKVLPEKDLQFLQAAVKGAVNDSRDIEHALTTDQVRS